MTNIGNLLSNITDYDRAIFIGALNEYPSSAKKYTHDHSAATFNKKVSISAKNKFQVKAERFSPDEIRILYLSLFFLKQDIVNAEDSGFSDEQSNLILFTIDKYLPALNDFLDSLMK